MPVEKDSLTDKQKVFAQEYIKTLNGAEAYRNAGYAGKNAHILAANLLAKPHVRSHIQELMNDRSERTGIDADYVLEAIQETVERCRQAEPVLDKKGNQVFCTTPDGKTAAAFMFDSRGVLKGAELLGKHLKLFTDVNEVKHTFTQMGRITISKEGGKKSLSFEVGEDPNAIDS